MLSVLRKAWRRETQLEGYVFGRPLIVLQSDDWGRVGVRDREGWEELRQSGVSLGEHTYDFYSLETAEDVAAVASLLGKHRDSIGRPPCLGMTFITANVDFAWVAADDFRHIRLRSLADGLPDHWSRPGLFEAYRQGISAGLFSPSLHGTTHFCASAAARYVADTGERGTLLRIFWKAGAPYIHKRMPWIGFEYSDPGTKGREVFLSSEVQEELIGDAIRNFVRLFSKNPRSACAPGYRANEWTHNAWAKHGIQVAQNGPGRPKPPHFETSGKASREHGGDSNPILNVYRTLDFEPAASPELSLSECLGQVEESFARGIPAIISVHSINFHSTLKDFRSRTLRLLDELLSAIESRHPDLLYLQDEDLYQLVTRGSFDSTQGKVRVPVMKETFQSRAVVGAGRS